MSAPEPTVLIASPSSDVYGSDLQMLESVSAMADQGWRVVVTTPEEGPLIEMLEGRGASVERLAYPVVRRQSASITGLLALIVDVVRALPRIHRTIRRVRPSVVYANSITIPWWLLVARLSRVPCVCHVHEAEREDSGVAKAVLYGPLLLANLVIVNSPSSLEVAGGVVPRLRARARLVYNGVPGPPDEPRPPAVIPGPRRLAVIGRLSPRKGTDVALEAVALLRQGGHDVTLDVCGSAFAGYEWFVQELEERAAQPDLDGAVSFSGYVRPVWPVLDHAEVVLAPSPRESFGNVVVEGQLAARPVVAAAAMGHLHIVDDGTTGILVPVGDARAMADAAASLLDDPERASSLASLARSSAQERFSIERYRREIAEVLDSMIGA